MEEKTLKLLKFIRFLDEARWKSGRNYDIPNYADKDMPANQKLLTHFLGYITNRRISYKLIFAKLDFIFSQLVIDFSSQGSSSEELLLDPGTYIDCDDGGKNGFKASRPMNDQAQYSKDKSLCKELIEASSRFFPNDFVGIFCTLKVLEEFAEKNFTKYILKCLSLATPRHDLEFLLYGLWLLGYSTGRWEKEDLDYQKIYERCLKPKFDAINSFFNGGGVPKTFRKERYKSKRLTCFVRDLLKCEHYSLLFREIIPTQVMDKLQNQLYMLELPGDVWNNNEHFQQCLNQISEFSEQKKTISFNKRVRNFFEKEVWKDLNPKDTLYYPEQFDTTFDFVPRMCETFGMGNCDYCPLGEKSNGRIPDELCLGKSSENEQKFCPFLLYACGYKVKCKDIKYCCPNKE